MKKLSVLVVTLALITAAAWTAHSVAQPPASKSDSLLPAPKTSGAFEVPEAALLTERGRQLTHELQMLKRNRASMGARHPSLSEVNEKIQAVKETLAAWEPTIGDPANNPFRKEDASGQITEVDLRQLVIQMSKRIDELGKRVDLLEKR